MSYRFSFVFQVASTLLSIAAYYFLARFIEGSLLPGLHAYGGDYSPFVLIGMALHDFFMTSLRSPGAFARISWSAPWRPCSRLRLPSVVVSSCTYPFLWTSFVVVLYLGLGVGMFGLRLTLGNWPAAVLILIMAILVFSGFGILSGSFIIVFKRGSPIAWFFGGLSWLLGGVLYPITVLPDWLRQVSAMLPITYAIEGMRAALLRAAPWSEIWGSIGPLLLFALAVLPLSLLSFHHATRWARITGTLAQY